LGSPREVEIDHTETEWSDRSLPLFTVGTRPSSPLAFSWLPGDSACLRPHLNNSLCGNTLYPPGVVAERLKAAVLKTAKGESPS
jgi:hypothetical protein